VTNHEGRLVYHHSWVTNLTVRPTTIRQFVEAGRARWKIENEQFNVQKNHGSELEHHYGHGQQQLSFIFYRLNLLAFLWPQLLELTDRLYPEARRVWGSQRQWWEHRRTVMDRWPVASWWPMVEVVLADEPDVPGP